MARINKQNIDRKTNKPNPRKTEGFIENDVVLNRADQIRRDDDVIITPKRTVYDIDYAIKWYIENEIRPQITAEQHWPTGTAPDILPLSDGLYCVVCSAPIHYDTVRLARVQTGARYVRSNNQWRR